MRDVRLVQITSASGRSWSAIVVLAVLLQLIAMLGSAHAVMPDEILGNPVLEKRARALSQQLRCLVCQNQSIDDSDAPLARDLRLLLRERLSKGDSDAAAIDFIVARYGTFVLLKPPVQRDTLLLWLAPLLLLAAAILGFSHQFRRRGWPMETSTPLTTQEARRITDLLGKDKEI